MIKRLLILLPLLILLIPAPMLGQTQHRAGLVVRFDDGSTRTSCVEFAEESISGLDLLQRSGLDVIAMPGGGSAAVCKIGDVGCNYPAEPCFCKFGAGQGVGEYWAYWRLVDGAWQYAATGAGSNRVVDGAVEGWAWGTGNVQTGVQPPAISFEEVCPVAAPPAPTDVPTAIPTVPPAPSSTASVVPVVPPTRTSTPVVLAQAPSATIVPPSAIPATTVVPTDLPTIAATGTPIAPTSSPTIAATATLDPTAPPTSEPVPTPLAAGAATDNDARSNTAGYMVFAIMLAGLIGAIAVALWRRR